MRYVEKIANVMEGKGDRVPLELGHDTATIVNDETAMLSANYEISLINTHNRLIYLGFAQRPCHTNGTYQSASHCRFWRVHHHPNKLPRSQYAGQTRSESTLELKIQLYKSTIGSVPVMMEVEVKINDDGI